MAKRVGWLRAQALINKNGTELHPRLKMPAGGAGTQGDTTIIIGKNGWDSGDADPYEAAHATQKFPLGTKIIDCEREYRYVKAAENVLEGKTVQMGALDATINSSAGGRTVSDAVDGGTEITFEGGGASTADQWAEGYLIFTRAEGDNEGMSYKIKSNTAASDTVLTLYDKLRDGSSGDPSNMAILVYNTYDQVITAPATFTGPIIGVSMGLTSGQYGWVQVRGPASVFFDLNSDGTSGEPGENAYRSDEVNGKVYNTATASERNHQVVGTFMSAIETECCAVWLTIE